MNWLWVIAGALVVVIILKMMLKTLKIMFIFAIVAILVAIYFLWQYGLLATFK